MKLLFRIWTLATKYSVRDARACVGYFCSNKTKKPDGTNPTLITLCDRGHNTMTFWNKVRSLFIDAVNLYIYREFYATPEQCNPL